MEAHFKSIPHSRDTTHNCVGEPSFHLTFVLTCRRYNYTHYNSNIPYFPPQNMQFYPEKITIILHLKTLLSDFRLEFINKC